MLIDEVGNNQQALQHVRDPHEKGHIWDKINSFHQKYCNIKDIIKNTGEEAIQNDWEFFKDMDKYLKNDPSIEAPITSDSINGIKHKEKNNTDNYEDEDECLEDIQSLIKEQMNTIVETIKEQYLHTCEVQQ
ncbi:16062_t:CDS:2 [Cetraspora pellucida]|uniref:16062_t:CDS:1 n=1 Tax=Cetraspora pellucida TaxID=1433469 RepID=A0A9N9JLV8_9GLOM|nr:16062_t:CDS:2 [Cetraspora pellucida]